MPLRLLFFICLAGTFYSNILEGSFGNSLGWDPCFGNTFAVPASGPGNTFAVPKSRLVLGSGVGGAGEFLDEMVVDTWCFFLSAVPLLPSISPLNLVSSSVSDTLYRNFLAVSSSADPENCPCLHA